MIEAYEYVVPRSIPITRSSNQQRLSGSGSVSKVRTSPVICCLIRFKRYLIILGSRRAHEGQRSNEDKEEVENGSPGKWLRATSP